VVWRRFFACNALAWSCGHRVTLLATVFVRHLDVLADDLSLAGLVVLAVVAVAFAVVLWRRVRREVDRDAVGLPDDGEDGEVADPRPGDEPRESG